MVLPVRVVPLTRRDRKRREVNIVQRFMGNTEGFYPENCLFQTIRLNGAFYLHVWGFSCPSF